MQKSIKVLDHRIAAVFYKGHAVVTLPQVDMLHGKKEETAGKNFRRNRKHFIQDVDYFIVSYEEWRDLFGPVNMTGPKNGKGGHRRGIILLTITGYLMIVKSFTDDLSWDIQRKLVIGYFFSRPPAKPMTAAEITAIRERILSGAGASHVAREFGRSRSTIKKYTVSERAAKIRQLPLFQ